MTQQRVRNEVKLDDLLKGVDRVCLFPSTVMETKYTKRRGYSLSLKLLDNPNPGVYNWK